MSITRERIEAQLAALQQEQQQMLANLNATNGAIQICRMFLASMDSEAAVPGATVEVVDAELCENPAPQESA